MSSPLIEPIAQALLSTPQAWPRTGDPSDDMYLSLLYGETAADACIAVVAAMPADYTAVDVLAALRGEAVPSEPLPVKALPPEGLLGGGLAAAFDRASRTFLGGTA